jgi:hypothetical protein
MYHRRFWHIVSGCLFAGYTQYWSPVKGVYNPKAFILHAASLRQGFPHCARFLIAASRRSLGRVAVPVWLIILSDQLPVIGLVGYYPTNNLIGREPFLNRKSFTVKLE